MPSQNLIERFSTSDPANDPLNIDPIDVEGEVSTDTPPPTESLIERFSTPVEPEVEIAGQPEGLSEEFGAGINTGVDNLQMLFFGLNQLVGRELGIESLEAVGSEGVERNAVQAQLFAPSVQSFSNEVTDMDTFFKWAAGGLGTQVPILASMIATGGIGSTVARTAISTQLRQTVKGRVLANLRRTGITGEAAERAAEKVLTSEVGFKMLRDNLVRGKLPSQLVLEAGKRGGTAGVLAFSIPAQISEVDIGLTEAGIDAGFTSLVAGVVGGAMEAVSVIRFLDRAFPGVDRAVATAFVRDFVKGTGIQLAIEGSTEAAQQAIQIAAQAYHDPSFDMLNPENIDQIVDSFAAGALVGAVLGGLGEAVPGVRGLAKRVADRVEDELEDSRRLLPEFELADETLEDTDFVAADNTFFEEVKDRINTTVRGAVEPAMNSIRDTFQDSINKITSSAPLLAGTLAGLKKKVAAAHNEFVAGHQHVIDDTLRWAREQAEFITEQAEGMLGPERQAFVKEKMTGVQAQIEEVVGILRERADQVADSINREIDGAGVFEEDVAPADVTEPETPFIFGKEGTEGEQAVGWKERKGAERRIVKLMEEFPSASESSFEVRQQEDGTYIVAIADSGQAEVLQEDRDVTKALELSMASARENPDGSRMVSIQRKGVKGRTLLDAVTLVFEGRRIGPVNQTVEQGFAAVVGRLLDRGIIDNEGAITLKNVFDEQFPGTAAQTELREAFEVDNRIKRLESQLTDIPQATLDTPEGQRAVAAQREELFELRQQSGRPQDVNKTLADRAEITEEVTGDEGDFTDPEADIDDAAAAARGRPTRVDPLRAEKEEIKRLIARLPPENERTAEQKLEVADLNAGLKELQDAAPEPNRRTTRKPKRKPLPKRPPKKSPNDTRRAIIKRLEAKKKAKKKLTAKEKKTLARVKRELKAADGEPTPIQTKAKRRPKAAQKLNAKTKVVVWMPGAVAAVRNATQEIADRVSKLLSEGSQVRIINQRAAEQMVAQDHEHADKAQAFLNLIERTGNENGVIYDHNGGVSYVFMSEKSLSEEGAGVAQLIHELGHIIHYDSWINLARSEQDALWNAFITDVRSGKRKTGAALNRAGGRLNKATLKGADENIFEFKEWMADQFVDWMNDRQQPRTAIEKFLEAVAVKLDSLVQFLRSNPGRYGMLNATYTELIDGIALGLRNVDPTGNDQHFLNENAAGRPTSVLIDGAGQIVPAGLTRGEWGQLKIRISTQYPQIAERAALMTAWIQNAYSLALAPSTSVMRELSKRVAVADRLVTFFNRPEHGQKKRSKNYHQRLDIMKGQFMDKLRQVTESMTEAEKSKLLKSLRALDGTEGAPKTRQEKALRELFDEVHDYMLEQGLPVGRINNYFPKTFNRERMVADEEKIIAHLIPIMAKDRSSARTPRQRAREFYSSLISSEADEAASMAEVQADELAMQTPSFRNMRSRTAGSAFFDQYLDDNLDGIMGNYIIAAVKRAEYNAFLGAKAPRGVVGGDTLAKNVWNSRGELDKILRTAKNQGATKDDLKMMKRYVEANLGMYGRDDVSDSTRTAMATIVAYNNLRVLLFTVFASLPDLVGPAIRSGDLGASFKTTMKNIRAVVSDEGSFADMARAWGQISSLGAQSVLTEYVDNHYMPAKVRKWNDAFFTWTGLNYYTDFTRKMALAVGIDSLKNEAKKATDKTLTQKQRDRAKQFLAEFGLKDSDVKKWVARDEPVWGKVGYDGTHPGDQLIAEALVQFVSESIMRPNASQRPILASHPAAMLVFHLKGFIYSIHDVVLKRLVHNFNIADNNAQIAAAIAPAILMLALTAFGLELRELITGDRRSDRMDGWDYTWTITERSGLLGISQLGFDFESAGARGQSELAALGGPAISQLGSLISQPVSQTIPKAIPVVSQLPWARDALRAATPLGN